jgi:hypothetical protein
MPARRWGRMLAVARCGKGEWKIENGELINASSEIYRVNIDDANFTFLKSKHNSDFSDPEAIVCFQLTFHSFYIGVVIFFFCDLFHGKDKSMLDFIDREAPGILF